MRRLSRLCYCLCLTTTGLAQAEVFVHPSHWHIGLRDQHEVVSQDLLIVPTDAPQQRVRHVQTATPWLQASIIRPVATPFSPAKVKLTAYCPEPGLFASSVFISFEDESVVRIPVNGWGRKGDAPADVEVFFSPGAELLSWWNKADHQWLEARVRFASIEDLGNYRKLRGYEEAAGTPPAEVVAVVDDGTLVIPGNDAVRHVLSGLLEPGTHLPRALHSEAEAIEIPDVPAGKLGVWMFYFSDCSGCRAAREKLTAAAEDRPDRVHVQIFDATENPQTIALAYATLHQYPLATQDVPSAVAFVGDEVLLGSDEIETYIDDTVRVQLGRDSQHHAIRRPDAVPPLVAYAWNMGVVPIVLAALADGVNPCAFASIVLLISVLSVGGSEPKRRILLGGGSFCLGVFATYYAAGVAVFAGLRQLRSLAMFETIVFWTICSLALLAGIISIIDAVRYWRSGDTRQVLLKVPAPLQRRFGALMRSRFRTAGLVFGGLTGGVLIALLEGVCTGQMYLPTIQYMARTPGLRTEGMAWLLLYNALFILPLVAIVGFALAGVHFRRLTEFLQRHMAGLKLLLGVAFLVLVGAMVAVR